jgi:Uma2 family endonuclease
MSPGERVAMVWPLTLQAWAFKDPERLELIRGILVRTSPPPPAQALVIQILTRMLVPPLVGRADVRVQLPFAATDESMPEPDIALVEVGRFGRPHPIHASLVIEVAETSLEEDRTEKAELYAQAGVPEYWVVNIPDRSIEVHTEPSRGAYTRVTPYRVPEKVAPGAFADVTVDLGALFATER